MLILLKKYIFIPISERKEAGGGEIETSSMRENQGLAAPYTPPSGDEPEVQACA